MEQRLYDAVTASPVIAAVKDKEGLEDCLALEQIQVVFLLFGDICSVAGLVDRAKAAGKLVMVHADLVGGLAPNKEIAVDFLRTNTRLDGIISTRPAVIQRAKRLGLYTVLRLFVIDSMALEGIERLEAVRPDFIEILPGVMPKTIRRVARAVHTPLLAGGLIADKEDVITALGAGAVAVSATSREVWRM